MSDCRWWAQFIVAALVAAGTIGAVIVALFGKKFHPPKLRLEVLDPGGKLGVESIKDSSENMKVRYYHLRVYNKRRWAPARGVWVVLLQVEEPGLSGPLVTFNEALPLTWRYPVVHNRRETIGQEAAADLCAVTERRELRIPLCIKPKVFKAERAEKSEFVFTIQARGEEAESNIVRVKIKWDGNWHEGETEMKNHLSVKTIDKHVKFVEWFFLSEGALRRKSGRDGD
jgi:hypothetical protein